VDKHVAERDDAREVADNRSGKINDDGEESSMQPRTSLLSAFTLAIAVAFAAADPRRTSLAACSSLCEGNA
ncbi:MAG: hypothetical protein ABSC06_25280, partial [Rhodopila sp.]